MLIVTAIWTYGSMQAAELRAVQEPQTRPIRISAAGISSFIKISEHIYGNKLDPVLWRGMTSLDPSEPVELRVSAHLKRISLYESPELQGAYLGSAFIDADDWAKLVSILHINSLRGNYLKLTFFGGTESCIELKKCKS